MEQNLERNVKENSKGTEKVDLGQILKYIFSRGERHCSQCRWGVGDEISKAPSATLKIKDYRVDDITYQCNLKKCGNKWVVTYSDACEIVM